MGLTVRNNGSLEGGFFPMSVTITSVDTISQDAIHAFINAKGLDEMFKNLDVPAIDKATVQAREMAQAALKGAALGLDSNTTTVNMDKGTRDNGFSR